MPYRRYGDGDGWAFLIVLIAVIFGFVLYWGARLAWAALTEAVRIYHEHGFLHTATGKLLRWSLLAFVVVVIVSSLGAALLPMTAGVDAGLICWSFFLWSGIVASCSWFAGKRDRLNDLGDLDTYLDFTPTRNPRTLDGMKGNGAPAASRGEGVT